MSDNNRARRVLLGVTRDQRARRVFAVTTTIAALAGAAAAQVVRWEVALWIGSTGLAFQICILLVREARKDLDALQGADVANGRMWLARAHLRLAWTRMACATALFVAGLISVAPPGSGWVLGSLITGAVMLAANALVHLHLIYFMPSSRR